MHCLCDEHDADYTPPPSHPLTCTRNADSSLHRHADVACGDENRGAKGLLPAAGHLVALRREAIGDARVDNAWQMTDLKDKLWAAIRCVSAVAEGGGQFASRCMGGRKHSMPWICSTSLAGVGGLGGTQTALQMQGAVSRVSMDLVGGGD
jgi:hypothetical protein